MYGVLTQKVVILQKLVADVMCFIPNVLNLKNLI